MATYKGIQGYTVQSLASDPTVEDTVGQLWYNNSTGKFKIAVEGAGTWAAGGNMSRSQLRATGTCGTQTAGLVAGGDNTGSPELETEIYDGTSWTEVADINTGRYGQGGAGSTTAAIIFGGAYPPVGLTETYNGSTWTEVADLNTARYYSGSTNGAPQTACLCIGGSPQPGAYTEVESWNGTSWTEIADLNVGKSKMGGAGITTAALCFGGSLAPGVVATTETFNGTSWTEVNDLNTGREYVSGAGATNTAALAYGGKTGPGSTNVAVTEKWNGTGWTEVADLGTAKYQATSIGTSSLALAGGGRIAPPGVPSFVGTEEWTDPVYSIKTVTVS